MVKRLNSNQALILPSEQASCKRYARHRCTALPLRDILKVKFGLKPVILLQPNVDKLLKKHRQLNHLDAAKVTSHVQRESGDWIVNTLMLDGYDVPFKYSRKTAYKNLEGARVNLTYYSETKTVSGLEFEIMNVVRIRRA